MATAPSTLAWTPAWSPGTVLGWPVPARTGMCGMLGQAASSGQAAPSAPMSTLAARVACRLAVCSPSPVPEWVIRMLVQRIGAAAPLAAGTRMDRLMRRGAGNRSTTSSLAGVVVCAGGLACGAVGGERSGKELARGKRRRKR
jgi:hypothetical protein